MGRTVTKKEIVERVAQKTHANRRLVKEVIETLQDEITGELVKGNRIEFRYFGVFDLCKNPARIAHNPRSLERVKVPAKRTVRFKMSKLMKKNLANSPHPPSKATK